MYNLHSKYVEQWFQPGGREQFLEGSWKDILCTQLYYICFIQGLDGGHWVIVGFYNYRWVAVQKQLKTTDLEYSNCFTSQ